MATDRSLDTISPERIEEWRKLYSLDLDSPIPVLRQAAIEKLQLCELALDGLRFRAWCSGASNDAVTVAKLLAKCCKPGDYREAIDKYIVELCRRG